MRLLLILLMGTVTQILTEVRAPAVITGTVVLIGMVAIVIATWKAPWQEEAPARRHGRRKRWMSPMVWFLVGRWTMGNHHRR